MSCLVAFFCALTSAQAEIAIKQRPLPIGGVSEKGRWTYHGGVMYIRKLVMSPDGTTLWAATSKGVIKLDIGREHLTRFTTLDGLADTYVTDLDIDADGAVWAATYSGLSKYTKEGWSSAGVEQGLSNIHLQSVAVDADGQPWVSGYGHSNSLISHRAGNRWVDFSREADAFTGSGLDILHRDSSGKVWAATYDTDSSSDPNIVPKRTANHLIVFNDVAVFQEIPLPKHLLSFPRRKTITSIANARDGRVLVGSILGLFAWDGKTWTRYGRREGLREENIQALAPGPEKTTWILTRRGIYSFDGKKAELRTAVPQELQALTQNTNNFAVGADGDVWLTMEPSVALVHGDGAEWTVYIPTLDGPVTQPGSGVHRILMDASGALYFAAQGTRGGFTRRLKNDWEILYHGDVNDAALDKNGVPWIVSRRVLRYANEWQNESARLGITSAAHTIHRDQRGNLWIGGSAHLLQWNGAKAIQHHRDHPAFKGPYTRLTSGPSGHLWVWYGQGVAMWRGDRLWNPVGKLTGMPGLKGKAMAVGPRGGVYIGGSWGAADYDGVSWQHFVREGDNAFRANPVLPGRDVRAIFVDSLNTTWFATDEGIATFDGRQWSKMTASEGLASNSVWSVFEDKESFWFGTMAGLSRFKKLQ